MHAIPNAPSAGLNVIIQTGSRIIAAIAKTVESFVLATKPAPHANIQKSMTSPSPSNTSGIIVIIASTIVIAHVILFCVLTLFT